VSDWKNPTIELPTHDCLSITYNFMTWLVSMLVALLCGVAGLFLGGLIANSCVSWYQISSREGQSGFFVIFVALGGGIAGLILGLTAARLVAWNYGPGFGRELLGAVATLLLVSGVSAWICRVLADIPPTIDGRALTLEVEFRFPNTFGIDASPTSVGDWQFTLASLSGRTRRAYVDGIIQTAAARHENGQWIVPTHVELFTERGSRSVTLAQRDASEVMSFLLPLPARPDASFEKWSEWLPRMQANGQSWPADKMSCRFRIQKTPGSK
jgi:hypothetical protein